MSSLLTENFIDKFNVLIIGDKGVGKTSIIKKLIQTDESDSDSLGRLSGGNISNYYEKPFKYENTNYYFKIWESPSNEREFKRNYLTILKKADCIIIVCASNNKESFNSIIQWESLIKTYLDRTKKIYLICNKSDLDEEREIGEDELKQKCDTMKIKYFETSARSGFGINKAFDSIFKKIIQKFYKEYKEDGCSTEEQFEVEQIEKQDKGLCSKCLSKCIIF